MKCYFVNNAYNNYIVKSLYYIIVFYSILYEAYIYIYFKTLFYLKRLLFFTKANHIMFYYIP